MGDPHSHGGEVISASGQMFVGKPVMLIGDVVSCPEHGKNPVNQGHPTWTMMGRNVVLDGHQSKCGCTLHTTLPQTGAD
ncbi:PAAR domain-containing protein [Thorsellia anophelis]|uniref:PAAR domain-containing protein n=1 Tax=Thorsellia anophelis TaxID=336804 RepID=UPI003CCC0A80